MLRRVPVWAVWLVGLIPLALVVFDLLIGRMGVDPIREIEHRLGQTALYFLAGGLAVTPLLRITGISLMKFRRAIGLLCFSYVVPHVLAWMVLDMGLLWSQMLGDVIKRPYLLVGMLALAILIPLSVTSNNLSIRRMGGQAWRRLHKAVYAAAILAGLHWLWAVKVNELQPWFWFVLILVILGSRVVLRGPIRWGVRRSSGMT
ncbi:protein-methionine-sulfoxide reductase heme-binding subunit MsrQ [Paracoccus sp. 1_MG-2023]|uniref:sulfite oxidase heme-binding subunit YedZ n=2 Tax=unclassified Paracoccus (in: a-proteobacteria) TaxID=2688777 RepID=UPI0026E1FF95|nr:protein-methionine-sulfoxide reductase heme-binding subunit MsrQ [Paracoccus sp. 1_MG-2023]MDO6670156.1 protein-methionine-sulfoxide reductase heme-binding subunit MsrQ [Paracoccus sp. 1_MG-2023]